MKSVPTANLLSATLPTRIRRNRSQVFPALKEGEPSTTRRHESRHRSYLPKTSFATVCLKNGKIIFHLYFRRNIMRTVNNPPFRNAE